MLSESDILAVVLLWLPTSYLADGNCILLLVFLLSLFAA